MELGTKDKGDFAEARVLADLVGRGLRVAIPYGDNARYDLILERAGKFERVQVKYVESGKEVITLRCYSTTVKAGGVYTTNLYTPDQIDWIAAYDRDSETCYYVPAAHLNDQGYVTLRIAFPRNAQTKGVRWAAQYASICQCVDDPRMGCSDCPPWRHN